MSVDYAFAEGVSGDREDQSLVQRARAGDRDALEALIKRHQGWIYNLAVRMLFHPQDAEDATQEILTKTAFLHNALWSSALVKSKALDILNCCLWQNLRA